ncbi:MAG: glycosyltransferase family 4 protein [Spirulinaceae cyanobacterium RM2_2_10]|nr:glycosyltransferase family 4 protein [Spirulinaceae cyanobacterium SM2_1_0]NJO19541.1 glycosyltransferase family 4 protein [Spirulinaceae cyanobacterium RM2_2_10]
MKILVLAWEFPPRIVGGIARHVAELYPELSHRDCEIHLLTVEFGQAPAREIVDGIRVYRVPVAASNNFFHWVVNLNTSMGARGGKLLQEQGPFDLIHAHDWLVGDAAIALKHRFKLPLVATIHATEFGRYNGIHTDTHRYIHYKEQQLIYEAWRVIVCSQYMRQELQRAFQTPADKVDVIFNGIRAAKKALPADFDRHSYRRRFAADSEQIVYYLGRMSYEKGIPVLLNAAPKICWELGSRVKFAIVGGGNTEALKQQAWALGIWHRCHFTGFMPEADLDRFQAIADCAVFPSLYEPFGIVALESFAAQVPVVVSDTGGFPEVVKHGETGIVTYTNNADSLAWGILEVLKNPDYARSLTKNAYADLRQRFDWSQLAVQTLAVYQQVTRERQDVVWA